MRYVRSVYHFLRLGRPLFLVGGFVLHGLGVTIALYQGARLSLGALLWGQIAVTAVQLMTHYGNDYFDFAADRANLTPTQWSGGSRVLPDGFVRPGLALAAALLLASVAIVSIFVLYLGVGTGPLTGLLIGLALFLAWAYSAPPFRLHSRGVGEVTVTMLVPGLTPLVGYYLQQGRLALLPFLAVVPLLCFQFVMILAIEFPDAEGDAAAGKRTLVVRLGGATSAQLLMGALALNYLALPLLVASGLPGRAAMAVVAFSLPLSLWLFWRVRHGAWAQPRWWNWLGFFAIALLIGSAAMELVAFLSLVGGR